MNTCPDILSFNRSVELLNTIFPRENWSQMLPRNLVGLTEGVATIPFAERPDGIWYGIDDLERFAIEYGKGTPSVEEIVSIGAKYRPIPDVHAELTELLDNMENADDSCQGPEFFLKAPCDANGNILLSPEDVSVIRTANHEVVQEQLESAYTLTALAVTFRSLEFDTLSTDEATALSGMAEAQAARAGNCAARTRSLVNAFDNSPAPRAD